MVPPASYEKGAAATPAKPASPTFIRKNPSTFLTDYQAQFKLVFISGRTGERVVYEPEMAGREGGLRRCLISPEDIVLPPGEVTVKAIDMKGREIAEVAREPAPQRLTPKDRGPLSPYLGQRIALGTTYEHDTHTRRQRMTIDDAVGGAEPFSLAPSKVPDNLVLALFAYDALRDRSSASFMSLKSISETYGVPERALRAAADERGYERRGMRTTVEQREQRRAYVASCIEKGMTRRQVAQASGWSDSTICRDYKAIRA
jgi:hypothetical protein